MYRCRVSFACTTFAVACAIYTFPGCEAHAAATVSVLEQDGDVIVKGSGKFDLSALSFIGDSPVDEAWLNAELATFAVGRGIAATYETVSGPDPFGGGDLTSATSSSGEPFGARQDGNGAFVIFVPRLYDSGETLSAEATYAGETFSSLGLTPGAYHWTWGSGDSADSLTMLIGIPEPSSFALLAIGAVALAIVTTVRRR